MVRWITCDSFTDSAQVGWPEDAVDLEVRLVDLVSGDYSCALHQVHTDPGAPSLVSPDRLLAMRGTLRVVPEEERVVDFPFLLTP